MTHPAFLHDLLVVAALAVAAALAVQRLRLPAVAGLLLTGAVAGPYGLSLVHDLQDIEALAEIGVIVLLFTIGLELSLEQLRRIVRPLTVGGGMQVGLTVTAVAAGSRALGRPWGEGVFLGFLVALSSTAVVLRGLSERHELDAPHGRVVVGTLVFQDLCVVPMMLVLPVLAGQGTSNPAWDVAKALAVAGAVVAATMAVARLVVPPLFQRIDALHSREVFLLAVLAVCVGTGFLTAKAGLSVALGAFLAGVILADSDFGHRALADVLPLRDLFTSLFFVSLGMLFDARALLEAPWAVAGAFALLFFGKGLLATLSVLPLRAPLRVAVLAGVSLAQFGEFGFVLAKAGRELGLMDPATERVVLTAGILTMFVTPLAIRLAPHFAAGAARLHGLARLLGAEDISEPAPEHAQLASHVVVAGFGVAGRVLAKALKSSQIPYLILELDAERVRQGRASGEPIYYGDVSSAETMGHARVREARAVVLLINDRDAARRALAASRHHAPGTPVVMRTRFLSDRAALLAAGAAEVVCEEVEGALEVLARVLRRDGFPRNVLAERLQDARADTTSSARVATVPRPHVSEVAELDALKVERFLVRDRAHAAGRSIASMQVRSRTGALVVALHRGGRTHDTPDVALALAPGDTLFVMGSGPSIARAMLLLETGGTPEQADG